MADALVPKTQTSSNSRALSTYSVGRSGHCTRTCEAGYRSVSWRVTLSRAYKRDSDRWALADGHDLQRVHCVSVDYVIDIACILAKIAD
jgi:hypothetical protein